MLTKQYLKAFSRIPRFYFASQGLSQAELLQKIKNGEATVIDVREIQADGDLIKDCYWMSPTALKGGWAKLLDKKTPYVVY